ncbi:hypothetical protein CDAR_474591 [Caerostris darwini]|uniref:Uncharacterized protein n=1 Tax=Caerostris darwini TaxID=1538125 RepID=A0AAV4PNY6_9ARAC|nr:hypothetical protein CDAR_474591 [Caerostris darwini]
MSFNEIITSTLSNNLRLMFEDCRTANTLLRDPSLTLFRDGGSLLSKWSAHRMTKTKHTSSSDMRDTMHSSEWSQLHCAPTQNSLPHIR